MRKPYLLVIMVIALLSSVLMADEMPLPTPEKALPVNPTGLVQPNGFREAPDYTITTQPVNLLTSYYDYMMGGYGDLPMHFQPVDQGNGMYLTYHAKRTATGQRRIFYAYLDSNGNIVNNNELTAVQNWEGFGTVDVDPLSGKAVFSWHGDLAAYPDAEYEVQLSWDAFLDGIPGLISDPVVMVDNPISITSGTTTTTDNEFSWPSVQIGPSPNAGFRRVYISTSNATEHTGGKASENVYLAYADFNAEMIELGTPLTWSYNHIPVLDAWNVDTVQWRRPYISFIVGDDGKLYYIGYHIAKNGDDTEIEEPSMDVFVNENYGAGAWRRITTEPSFAAWNPQQTDGSYVFLDDNQVAYPDASLDWDFTDSSHFNTIYDSTTGKIHLPAVFGLNSNQGTYFPAMQTLRHMTFDTNDESFASCQVYPQSADTDSQYVPWDLDGNHQVDEYTESGFPVMNTIWPFNYWDETIHENLMTFYYNNIKLTEPNEQGMMAMVWQDSWRARMYNKFPEDYPELAPFANAPEIYIAVSPNRGETWSEPIVMNRVETPALANAIPMWVYPANEVKFISHDNEGHDIGRLYLMYYDDISWGSYQQTPPVGQNTGGSVKYMALDIVFPVANEDNSVVPSRAMLAQNYPNPFNPETSISFNLPKAGNATLNIYNSKGQIVKNLVQGNLNAGEHKLVWNGTDNAVKGISSGVYFYKLTAQGKTETRKMMLMK
jgi:hypothetical protein